MQKMHQFDLLETKGSRLNGKIYGIAAAIATDFIWKQYPRLNKLAMKKTLTGNLKLVFLSHS